MLHAACENVAALILLHALFSWGVEALLVNQELKCDTILVPEG